MARYLDARPRKRDLPVRYTAEVATYWRVWDALEQKYVDVLSDGHDQTYAEHLANELETAR